MYASVKLIFCRIFLIFNITIISINFQGKKSSKSTLFGVDFSVACQGCPDGVPFLVKKCVAEIDNRALTTKVIVSRD